MSTLLLQLSKNLRHSALDAESLSTVREAVNISMPNTEILGQAQDNERAESAYYSLKLATYGVNPA